MAIRGSTVLEHIREQRRQVENTLDRISGTLATYKNSLQRLEKERADTYQELARIYLPELEADAVSATLHEKQDEIKRILQEKEQREGTLHGLIEQNRTHRNELEQRLDKTNEEIETHTTTLSEIQTTIRSELDKNPEYQALLSQKQTLEQRYQRDEQFVSDFLRQVSQLSQRYKEDRFFSYLYDNQNYGKESYSPRNGLTSMLDRWLANYTIYGKKKKDFDALSSMPEILSTRLTQQQAEIDAVLAKMKLIEDARAAAYDLPKKLGEATELDARRDALLTTVQALDKDYQQYVIEEEKLQGNANTYYEKATSALLGYLQSQTIQDLKQRAKETPSPEDDNLIVRLEKLADDISTEKNTMRDSEEERRNVASQLQGMKQIETKFVQADYESSRSEFDSGFDITDFLLGYLAGRHSVDSVYRAIDHHQSFRPVETYTSHYRSSPSIPSFGGGSRHSGGSFGGGSRRTGGSFGGGGRRTGGRF